MCQLCCAKAYDLFPCDVSLGLLNQEAINLSESLPIAFNADQSLIFQTKVAVHGFCMLCLSTKVVRDETPSMTDLMNY